MVRLKSKLKGTTLIETLVSMVLLVTVISLTFLSVISIKKSFNNDLRTYAYLMADKYLEEPASIMFGDTIINLPSISLKITKEPFHDNSGLCIVTISVLNVDSIKLCELKGVEKTISHNTN